MNILQCYCFWIYKFFVEWIVFVVFYGNNMILIVSDFDIIYGFIEVVGVCVCLEIWYKGFLWCEGNGIKIIVFCGFYLEKLSSGKLLYFIDGFYVNFKLICNN